jgi:hypothetical protein
MRVQALATELLPELLPLLHLSEADRERLTALYSVDKGPVTGAEDGSTDLADEKCAVKKVFTV